MPDKTLKQIAAELRKRDRHDPMAVMRVSELSEIADALEGVAKRAYDEIDRAVCGIDEAGHFDIDNVREAMDKTIGDYCESDKPDTIDTIVDDMLNEGHTGPADSLEWVQAKMKFYAGRIKEAWKRQCSQSWHHREAEA